MTNMIGYVTTVVAEKGYALISVSKDKTNVNVLVPLRLVTESPLVYGEVLSVTTESQWSQTEKEKAVGSPGSFKLRATKVMSRKSPVKIGGYALMERPREKGVELMLLNGPRKGTTVWLPLSVAKRYNIALAEGTPIQVKFLAMADLRDEIESLKFNEAVAKAAFDLKQGVEEAVVIANDQPAATETADVANAA